MASTKTTILFLSLTLLLLSSATATATTFCATSDDPALCARLTCGAHTWADAMTNALEAVLKKAESGKDVAYGVASRLPRDFKPQTKQSVGDTCRQAYDSIVDNIKQCMGFVRSDPYSSLDTYLSATTFSDCTDGLGEFGVSLDDVGAFDSEMLKLSGVLLAVAQTKPRDFFVH